MGVLMATRIKDGRVQLVINNYDQQRFAQESKERRSSGNQQKEASCQDKALPNGAEVSPAWEELFS
jgi:hypothetical protein